MASQRVIQLGQPPAQKRGVVPGGPGDLSLEIMTGQDITFVRRLVVHNQAMKVVMAKTTAASALAADSGQVRRRRDFVVRGLL
jgi:hypothetical protein